MTRQTPDTTKDTASTWQDLRAEFAFSPEEEAEIAAIGERQLAAVRAHRLAEVRKQHGLTQKQLAAVLEISQERVSQIERSGLAQTHLSTVAAYVQALGGRLRVVADFGDEQYVLG